MTKDTQIEGLTEICTRVFGAPHTIFRHEIEELLADPAILVHIPAVKALQEENERLKEKLESQELSTRLAVAAMNKVEREGNQRIATLEAQLAGLPPIESDLEMDRHYIPVHPNWEIQTKGKGSSFRICLTEEPSRRWLVTDEHLHDVLEKMARDIHAAQTPTQPVSANQPYGGKVLPGYALVPIEPTKAMHDAGVDADDSDFERGVGSNVSTIYRAMLAASPSADQE